MQYFKNAELAKLHHVSKATVGNWVEAAKQGKLDLTLHNHGGKAYIANTATNIAAIEQIVEERKKYRNSRSAKTVTPRPEFYRLYNQAQIYDIVRNLEMYHEIPRQYNYFDGGADKWDKYTQRLAKEDVPNLLNRTIDLLNKNQSYIDDLIANNKRVNVVDIGVGNALPVKKLLDHLLDKGILARYIAIDISSEMLSIAKRNIEKWFSGRVMFEGFELDINYERFANILAEEYLKKDADDTVNLVLFLGGTPYNFRRPDNAFHIIHDSMGLNDFLFYTDKLETEEMRPQWFDFSNQTGKLVISDTHDFVFKLLNIDESFYEVEMGFDENLKQRYTRARLKVDLSLKFVFEEGERFVDLKKGSAILVWRSWQVTSKKMVQQFERNDFDILHSSKTRDKEYILTIAQVKCE